VRRTLSLTVWFVGVALLATATLSWLTYRSVRSAMQTEFARRLEGIAATGASQVSPADLADARLLGEEGSGYIALQVLLEQLRTASSASSAALLDSTRRVVYDTRGPERAELLTPLDTLARAALDRAYGGRPAVSPVYRAAGRTLQAGFAPVLDQGRVAAMVAIEAQPDYLDDLGRLGRSLLLTTLVIGLALAVLGAAIFRLVWSAVRLERRLSRAENLAAMGRLTATLAHEIKNPLAIIRGSAQRLAKLDPEARRMADSVVEEADRLSRTVARYLNFARPDPRGGGTGDAIAALDATLGLLEGEFRARDVTVHRAEPGPHEAAVPLDTESLKQVYLNLLLNALEAMAGGGRLEVAAMEARGRIEITITDDGPGIPPEALRDIGQPFTTTKAHGSGLGLFLTRRLLQSAGGTLELANLAGRGTRCTVRLPRAAHLGTHHVPEA
jgi:signal transduction histidine kinase